MMRRGRERGKEEGKEEGTVREQIGREVRGGSEAAACQERLEGAFAVERSAASDRIMRITAGDQLGCCT